MSTWTTRAAALFAVALLSGCGIGYKDLPLPGSKVRGETYSVSADFDQALNLAQGAQVKLNGISIGRVSSVTAKDYKAHVTMDLRSQITIPADSKARLRYDTPLGELIIQVTPGESPADLTDGGTFEDTSTAPSVEDALQSASMLINGGNLGELQVIATELNAAFGGREREIRQSTEQLTDFITQANGSSQDIAAALQSLGSVAVTLNQNRTTIRNALDDIGPAAKTLGEDTDEFVTVLKQADKLAERTENLARKAGDPLIEILQKLGPIADAVLSTRSVFRANLDAVIAVAEQLDRTVPSDTLPLLAKLHLAETTIASTPATAPAAARSSGSTSQQAPSSSAPASGLVDVPLVRDVTGVVKGTTDPVARDTNKLISDIARLLGGQQ